METYINLEYRHCQVTKYVLYMSNKNGLFCFVPCVFLFFSPLKLLFGSELYLAGVVAQRDQSSSVDAAESCVLHPLQPAAALPHLPVLLPRGLVQLQPSALLERRLSARYEADE